MAIKHWAKSWTLWFNTVMAPMVPTLIGTLHDQFPNLQPYLGNKYGAALTIVALANVALRFRTSQPIIGKAAQ